MLKSITTAILVGLFTITAFAGTKQLTFAWEKSTLEPDLAGFVIEFSTDETSWLSFADIPYEEGVHDYSKTEPLTSPDGESITYFFRIAAYDTQGNFSVWNNQDNNGVKCQATIDFQSPTETTNFTVTVQVNPQ